MKNVCQTCVFDLEYGLPVAVRDHALGLKDDIPVCLSFKYRWWEIFKTGDFNKEHFHQNLGKELALQGDDLREAHSAPNAFLERISQGRKGPYYKRNLPHICSFWVKVTWLFFWLGLQFFTGRVQKRWRMSVPAREAVRSRWSALCSKYCGPILRYEGSCGGQASEKSRRDAFYGASRRQGTSTGYFTCSKKSF